MTSPFVGCEPPRLFIAPPEVSNSASEVIDFYHGFGRRLDIWQQHGLRVGLGENADGMWTCFEVGFICQRQNGKGVPTEALELAALFLWGLSVTVHTAHRGDTVNKAFRSMRQLINDNPDLKRRCKPINESDDVIETLTGCRLEFKTRSGAGGRGLTGDLLIFDEALELREEQAAAIAPILIAVPHAQVWYTSTVPRYADQHLVKARADAMAGEPRMAWIEWGADPDAKLDDPLQLAKANPALRSGRLSLERLADLRRLLGDEVFRTECMGIWPATAEGAALDQRAFERMRDPQSHRGPGADVVFSIDVTPMLDWGTIGMWALRDDDLEHIQVVDFRPGIDWIPERAAELQAEVDPLAWAIDQQNGANALRPLLAQVGIVSAVEVVEDESTGKPVEKPRTPRRGEIVILQTDDACTATAQLIQAYHGEVLRWPGSDAPDAGTQAPLRNAVANVKTRPVGDRGQIAWGRRKSTVNIGPVVTITQCRYVYFTWHDVIYSEYDVLSSIPLADGQCPDCEAWSAAGPIIHYEDCRLARLEVPA